jgi:hypothetical protein
MSLKKAFICFNASTAAGSAGLFDRCRITALN